MHFGTCILPLAWLLDGTLGDPPNRWHPVAWQGRFLAWAEAIAPRADGARFAWGISSLLTGMGLSAGLAWCVARLARRLPMPIRLFLEAVWLKLAFSGRGLDRAAGAVENALRQGDLSGAQRLLSWHLVSRSTQDLDAAEVTAAAVESVAENLTDALIAPLCAYMAGGLPGVWAYRFAQTADSMWGYHDSAHEWLGKPAARLDDALNWLPARLAAGLITAAAALCSEDMSNAWRTRRREAKHTASPNAGQTMATMAGALHITLSKRGHYTLVGGDAAITPDTLNRARRIARAAGILGVVLFTAALSPFRRGRDAP
ncbi:MAG: adenosylcobinamide-phosphate synthase CbiB [Anaerolineae bacterium]